MKKGFNVSDSGDDSASKPPDQFVMYTHGWMKKFGPMLSESERRVYDALAIYFGPDHDGLVWPNAGTIADLTGYSRRQTVQTAIQGLKAKGLIEIIDWEIPISTSSGHGFRHIGGGAAAGRHNVFMMMHVDERGYHRAERCRATMAELRNLELSQAEASSGLLELAFRGPTWSELKQYVEAKFPNSGMPESLVHEKIGKLFDSEPVIMSIDAILMVSVIWPLCEIEAKYPDGGRPNMTIVWAGEPKDGRLERRGMRVWKSYMEKEALLKESGMVESIVSEGRPMPGDASELDVQTRLGRGPKFAQQFPKTAEASKKLGIIPHFLWSMAFDIFIDSGGVAIKCDKYGNPESIETKHPWAWTDKATADLASIYTSAMTPDQLANMDGTLESIHQAQKKLIRDFIAGVQADAGTEVPMSVRYRLIADFFNDTTSHHTSQLVPYTKLTAIDVERIDAELQRESVRAKTMTA